MSNEAESWDPSTYGNYIPNEQEACTERTSKWYRDNAAVFHALEQWQSNWEDYARDFEATNGRPPSSTMRDKNKAAYRRQLIEQYGRGEPDGQWLDLRIAHLEKRGMAPERGERR